MWMVLYIVGCSLSRSVILGFSAENIIGGMGLGLMLIASLKMIDEEFINHHQKMSVSLLIAFPLISAELHPLLTEKILQFWS